MKEFIKNHWENKAKTYKGSYEASWGDLFMVNLEIFTIGKYLVKGGSVLDVGCANGYSVFEQMKQTKLKSIIGVDFAKHMINEANKRKKSLGLDNAEFKVGDIRRLDFKSDSFDVVYTTRVLINLPTWREQIQGIGECIRVTKPGGRIIFSEAFWEPLIFVNSLRKLAELPALEEHDFNRYLKKYKLEEYLKIKGHSFKVDEFSSIYYLGSRFFRELVENFQDTEKYLNFLNKIFYDLEISYSAKKFGIQQAYIIEK